MKDKAATTDLLETPMEVCWQFDYEIDLPKLKNLYAKAKQHQWDAEQALDWDQEIDPSKPLIDESQFRFDFSFGPPPIYRFEVLRKALDVLGPRMLQFGSDRFFPCSGAHIRVLIDEVLHLLLKLFRLLLHPVVVEQVESEEEQ